MSVTFLAVGLMLFAVRQPFTRTLGLTLIAPSVIAGVVGGTVFSRTTRQVQQLEQVFCSDKRQFLAAEYPRMQQVVRSFSYYRAVYSLAAVLAASLAWFVARPSLQGSAVGLLVFASFGLIIDHYAEHRAISYLADLENLKHSSHVR